MTLTRRENEPSLMMESEVSENSETSPVSGETPITTVEVPDQQITTEQNKCQEKGEQSKAEQAKAEQAKAEQAKCEQAKAELAARKAEEALAEKKALVEQLRQEMREAECTVQEEAASCQRTQKNFRTSLIAACEAARLVISLAKSLRIAQDTMIHAQKAAQGMQQELGQKCISLEKAKRKVENLLRQLHSAKLVLSAVKRVANKAQALARNINCSTQRTPNLLQDEDISDRKKIRELLNNLILKEERRRSGRDFSKEYSEYYKCSTEKLTMNPKY